MTEPRRHLLAGREPIALARILVLIVVVAAAYALLAKAGLAVASINPSVTPIWPPTGLALAAVLIGGYRVWPGILLGAFIANVTNAGTVTTSAAIACGNMLEALVGGDLIISWVGGRHCFESPARIAGFAFIACIAAAVSATIGVGSLAFAGFAPWAGFAPIWLTWWLGDAAGALVVTPVIVLWAAAWPRRGGALLEAESLTLFAATALVGIVAFSPLLERTAGRDALGFLAVVPLLWAALRRGPRDTATVVLGLTGFAVWGALAGAGPFVRSVPEDSLTMLAMFMASITVPGLALSAEVAGRRRAEQELRERQRVLELSAEQRTAAVADANQALNAQIEQRTRIEAELRQQRIQLLEAQRLANLGSWSWDIAQDRITGSDQLFVIFGLLPHEFPRRLDSLLERIEVADRTPFAAAIDQAAKAGGKFLVQARIRRPDGRLRHLEGAGEAVRDRSGAFHRVVGVFHDVSQRREAEEALRANEEQHRLMVDSIRDYAIFMLDPKGLVTTWNAGAERIIAYGEAEILGRHFSAFTPEAVADDPAFSARLAAARKEGRVEEEGWRRRGDGSQFWANVSMSPVQDRSGGLRGFVMVVRDLTRQREAERRLRDYAERLRGMSRQLLENQEVQSRFLSLELHDQIAQVLVALKLNMLSLEGKTAAADSRSLLGDSVGIIDEALDQVRDLAHDLRPSMLDDLGLEPALRWFAGRQAERGGFTVEVRCDPVPPHVSSEVQTACFRVAQQALSNVARHAGASHVQTRVEVDAESLVLSVVDNGRGFEVGRAGSEGGAGRSFGLLGMQERVALLGGDLAIDSGAGGTRLVARFPTKHQAADLAPTTG